MNKGCVGSEHSESMSSVKLLAAISTVEFHAYRCSQMFCSQRKVSCRAVRSLIGFVSLYFQMTYLSILLASLVAERKIEPDRDKADKSAKLCVQFPWDVRGKSGMGAQHKNFWRLSTSLDKTLSRNQQLLFKIVFTFVLP